MSAPFSVTFSHGNASHTVPAGGHFRLPREMGFRDTAASELETIRVEVEAGASWQSVVDKHYAGTKPWLHSIIRDPSRTSFFASVLPSGNGVALDLGAGWGQITRPLATSRPVVAMEPVSERIEFIKAAAKQDSVDRNLAYVEADYLDIAFDTRFAVICAIGVLEWVGAFQNQSDPQDRQRAFLRKVKSELAAGGSLVLGIENRIGLKYILGCPDDHIGVAGIACLPAPLARAKWQASNGAPLSSFTYSHGELRQMLADAGFENIEFFGAFPDYKLPKVIIPFGSSGETLNAWLRENEAPLEHNGYDGTPLPKRLSEALNAHYRTLAQERTAHIFAPSFFVRAS